jgi:hypothetical protein
LSTDFWLQAKLARAILQKAGQMAVKSWTKPSKNLDVLSKKLDTKIRQVIDLYGINPYCKCLEI